MSNRFDELVAFVLEHEGGYVNDPKDPGGETNFGISKRAFPKEDIKALTRERAIELYKKYYWDSASCDDVLPHLQPIYFDTVVNAGGVTAMRLLLLAAGVTGPISPANMAKARAAGYVTVKHYAEQRLAYYDRIIAKNKNLERFRKGWTKRVNSFLTCLLIALLFASCSPCRKAQGWVAKAVLKCPELAQLHTDTLVITVPGDSVTLVAAYVDPDRDSLRAVIAQLSEALQAERELFVIEGAGSNAKAKHQVHQALGRVRRQVCYHAPVTVENETARGILWVDSTGVPRATFWAKPQRFTQPVTHQAITSGEVRTSGGIPWWIWLIITVLSLLSLGLFLAATHYRFHFKRLRQ